jgi:hypothetical protein
VYGALLLNGARNVWCHYWVSKDGQSGMAAVIKEAWSGHGAVVYRYAVNQCEYTGDSRRNWEDPRYRDVQPGGKAIVYFSASHP